MGAARRNPKRKTLTGRREERLQGDRGWDVERRQLPERARGGTESPKPA